jgi:hypothetical protein
MTPAEYLGLDWRADILLRAAERLRKLDTECDCARGENHRATRAYVARHFVKAAQDYHEGWFR